MNEQAQNYYKNVLDAVAKDNVKVLLLEEKLDEDQGNVSWPEARAVVSGGWHILAWHQGWAVTVTLTRCSLTPTRCSLTPTRCSTDRTATLNILQI